MIENGRWSKLMKTITLCLELRIGKINSRWKGIDEENPHTNPKNILSIKVYSQLKRRGLVALKGRKMYEFFSKLCMYLFSSN
jgi:hypothetical protein